MFKLSEIKELIKLVDQTSVQELEIENEGSRLTIRKPNKTETVFVSPAPAHPTYAPTAMHPSGHHITQEQPAQSAATSQLEELDKQSQSDQTGLHQIVSPMVGTFYRAPSPEAVPFVSVGDQVNEKSAVCIIEAMKLMNEIEAEINGEIVEVLVENGQLVEYGQPLFTVRTV